jgi:hypothetical protein
MFHLRRGFTLRRDQGGAKGSLQQQFLLEALGRMREGVEQRQCFREMGHHLGKRAPLEGSVSGLLQIHHGLMRILSPLKVHGQLCRYVAGLGTISCLQPCANAPVETDPPGY